MLRSLSLSMLPAVALISSLLALPLIACGGDSAFDDVPKPCSAGKLKCDGTCFDLQSSPQNCGACGNTCKDSEVCSQGTCKTLCDDGFAKCNRACVNLYTNADHCGGCSAECESDAICSLGSCSSTCVDKCGDTCTDFQTDARNCGNCGSKCATDEVCTAGKCVNICDHSDKCTGGCTINAVNYKYGTDNPDNPCETCTTANKTGWSPKAPGTECSKDMRCNEQRQCVGGCEIDGVVYPIANDHPTDKCKRCSPTKPGEWEAKGEGAPCGTTGQYCNSGNTCSSGCSDGTKFVLPGEDHPSDKCKKCSTTNPGNWDNKGEGTECGTGGYYCNSASVCAAGCAIGTEFVLVGMDHPTDKCKKCASPGAWDDKTVGSSCGPTGQYCDASLKCSTGCAEDGKFVGPGYDHPTDKCRKCSTTSGGGWENKGQGVMCDGMGWYCNAASICASGCNDNGTFVTVDASRPSNPCQVCASSGSFSNKGQGASCGGSGQYCDASNNCSTGCAVDSTFVPPLGDHPANKCQRCSSGSPGNFESKAEGASCGVTGQYCDSKGACSLGCSLDSKFYGADTDHPADKCQKCSTSKPGDWEKKGQGASCGGDGWYCDSGDKCSSGCRVGSTFIPPAGEHSTIKCLRCSVGSPGTFVKDTEGTPCGGPGQYCDSAGECSFGCTFGSNFYAAGGDHPTDKCHTCTTTAAGQWKPKGEGASCGGAGWYCDSKDKCNVGCLEDGKFYASGEISPTTKCHTCSSGPTPSWQPRSVGSLCPSASYHCNSDAECIYGCFTGGKVYASDSYGPETCQVCTPAAPSGWSVEPGRPCSADGGTMCRFDGTCINPLSVSVGGTNSCGITDDGRLYCWGNDSYGQLGRGSAGSDSSWPVFFPTLDLVISVAVGDGHTCVLAADGSVKCWGNNDHGQVGIGSSVPAVLVPTALAMNKIVAISSGLRHSCATAEDGDVKCWGSNYFDQLGCVTCSILERSPVAPYHLGNVSYLAAGQQNTCVVDPATDLLCWGDNEFHQSGGASAGAGETVFWPSYAFLSPFDRVSEVNKVMSGGTSTCYSMIGFGRDIYCFGSNTDGQLLADPLVYQSSFYPLRTALTASVVQNNIFDIQLGEKHGCLHSDMGVFCWGSNTFGQLGDGSVSSRHTAHQVSSLGSDSGVMRISCSNSNHCCALWKKGGSTGVKCWGNNSAHQVGVPRLADAFEVLPQNVNGFPPI